MIWRRGLVSFVAAVIAITAPAVAASAATASAQGPANHAHTADVRLPGSAELPVNFAPEGIATGTGSTFYAASLATGDIYRGNLRTGKGEILVNAPAGGKLSD